MDGKKRFIVLLLTFAMVLSQMSLAVFADDEAAGDPEQTVTEQTAEETQPEEAAFDQTVTVDNVDITVRAEKGVFPAGAELSAERVDVPDAIGADNAYAFDIKILLDGVEVQPEDNAKVEVSFRTAEVRKYDTEVYHMDGSEPEQLDVDEKGNTATVETTGFSTYVLVFTNGEEGSGTIKYSMGDNQEVELRTIVGDYRPPALNYQGYQFKKYLFNKAKVDLSDKIILAKNGAGEMSVKVAPGAEFDDNDTAYIKIPFEFETSNPEEANPAPYITVNITVKDTSEPGSITEPKAREGLIYSGEEQQLIDAGTTSVGEMQYKLESGEWIGATEDEPNPEKLIKGTKAGDYKVIWRVVLKNGSKTSTVTSGQLTAKISKKAATLTVRGGSKPYDGEEVKISDAAAVEVSGMVGAEESAEKLVEGTDYTLSANKSPIKAAGEYTINAETVDTSATLKNYKLTIVSGVYTITDKPASTIVKEVAESDPAAASHEGETGSFKWVYDGKKHGIKVNVTEPADATVYYSRTMLNANNAAADGYTNPENVYPSDAGTYPIYYYIVADGYTALAGSQTVTIDQAYLRATVNPPVKTVTYGDHVSYANQSWKKAQESGNVTFTAYKEETEQNKLDVDFSTIENLDQVAFDMGGYTGDMSDAGTYDIDLRNNLKSDNYIIRSTKGALIVDRKVITFDWSTPDEWVYDGQEHGIEAQLISDQLVRSDKGKVTIIYETNKQEFTNKATEVLRGDDWSVKSYTAKVRELGGERGYNYTFVSKENFDEQVAASATEAAAAQAVLAGIYALITGDSSFNYQTYYNEVAYPEWESYYTEYYTELLTYTTEKDFTIKPAELTLTPDELTIPYGDDPKDHEQTFTASGLVNNESIDDVLLGKPVEYQYWEAPTTASYKPGDTDAGKYGIEIANIFDSDEEPVHNTIEGLHAQNYQVSAEPGRDKLVVEKRVISNFSWEPKPAKFEYDGKYKTVTAAAVENDCTVGELGEQNSALYEITYTGDENTQINAKTYTTTAKLSERAEKNYALGDETNVLKWTIAKRPATIYVNSNVISYGQDPADKGYYIDDKKLVEKREDEKGPDKLGDITLTADYKKYGKPGDYTIDAVVNNLNENYYIAGIRKGTLTVKDNVTELVAKGKTAGNKAGKLSWNKVTGAAGYDVYMSKCNIGNKIYNPKKIASVSKTSYKVKKLKKGVAYKFYIVARDASGKKIAQSDRGHFIVGNVMGKYTNPKKITPSAKTVNLAAGKSTKVTAKITKVKKNKKLLNGKHTRKLRYFSANPAVAKVAQNGTITGVTSGWCRVYAVATDGMWSVIEVNVK